MSRPHSILKAKDPSGSHLSLSEDISIAVQIEKQRLLTYERRSLLKRVLSEQLKSKTLPEPTDFLSTAREFVLSAKRRSLMRAEEDRLNLAHSSSNTVGTAGNVSRMFAVDEAVLEHQLKTQYSPSHPEVIQEALLLAFEQGHFKSFEAEIETSIKDLAQLIAEQRSSHHSVLAGS